MGGVLKQQRRKYLLACILWAICALATTCALAEVVIVVSAKSKISSMTLSQVAQIYLGKTNKLPDGRDAVPFDQAEGSEIRNEFYSKVTGKDPAQINAYWSKIIFTGDGQPPKVVTGNDSVKKAVAKNLNAVGYIDKSAVDKKVKVILIP
jgi:ABC-type phosphate transport system substrate-binding protein